MESNVYTQNINNEINEIKINNEFNIHPLSDLHHFMQHIVFQEGWLGHRPYTQHKKRTRAYKMLFWGIALCFLFLTIWAGVYHPNWESKQLFGHSQPIQFAIITLTTLLMSTSASIAIFLRTEYDALATIIKKSKNKIKIFYRHCEGFSKHQIDELLFHIHHRAEEVSFILQHIAQSKNHAMSKEILFNQALLKFQLTLDNLISTKILT